MTASEIHDKLMQAVHADPFHTIHDESFVPCRFLALEAARDPDIIARLEAFLAKCRRAVEVRDEEELD